jgi:hypothetical protein
MRRRCKPARRPPASALGRKGERPRARLTADGFVGLSAGRRPARGLREPTPAPAPQAMRRQVQRVRRDEPSLAGRDHEGLPTELAGDPDGFGGRGWCRRQRCGRRRCGPLRFWRLGGRVSSPRQNPCRHDTSNDRAHGHAIRTGASGRRLGTALRIAARAVLTTPAYARLSRSRSRSSPARAGSRASARAIC